jgi:DNA-binding MarR family transcriptional regulator
MRVVAADVRKSGLEIEPFYIHLLGILSCGDRSLGELAEVLSVSAPTMSKTISTIETRGWVLRQRSETDGRVVMVRLTAQGQDILERARDYMVERIACALEPLSDDERKKLSSGLHVLGGVFDNVPSNGETARAP